MSGTCDNDPEWIIRRLSRGRFPYDLQHALNDAGIECIPGP